MNVPTSRFALAPAHFKSAVGETRRIGKAANSKAFGQCREQFVPCRDGLSRALRQDRPCQNGTVDYAPLWNGPALRPAFAAQVLGQAIVDRTARNSDMDVQAYRQGASPIPTALLLDVSI